MSVFDTASKKIHDLIGVTAAGQAAMAASVPVVVASNQSALPIKSAYVQAFAESANVTGVGDITVSTTSIYAGFAAPTNAFFDGADGGFDADPRWIKIPMGQAGWQAATIAVVNFLATTLSLTVTLKAMLWDGSSNGFAPVTIYSEVLGYGQALYLSPYSGGTGMSAALKQVPALLAPCDTLILELTPSGDPGGGFINLIVCRA